jgi:hypothetical protein
VSGINDVLYDENICGAEISLYVVDDLNIP